MVERVGVYPGTFDPITNGHVDIISRAARLVDRVVVGVARNIGKAPLFALEQRVDLVRRECAAISARAGTPIDVVSFDSLLIHFVRSVHGTVIVRGLRAVSDFDYEFQMAGMNYRLDPGIETVFLMASEHHQFISSRFVKEVAQLGGEVASFVPPLTLAHIQAHLAKGGDSE